MNKVMILIKIDLLYLNLSLYPNTKINTILFCNNTRSDFLFSQLSDLIFPKTKMPNTFGKRSREAVATARKRADQMRGVRNVSSLRQRKHEVYDTRSEDLNRYHTLNNLVLLDGDIWCKDRLVKCDLCGLLNDFDVSESASDPGHYNFDFCKPCYRRICLESCDKCSRFLIDYVYYDQRFHKYSLEFWQSHHDSEIKYCIDCGEDDDNVELECVLKEIEFDASKYRFGELVCSTCDIKYDADDEGQSVRCSFDNRPLHKSCAGTCAICHETVLVDGDEANRDASTNRVVCKLCYTPKCMDCDRMLALVGEKCRQVDSDEGDNTFQCTECAGLD